MEIFIISCSVLIIVLFTGLAVRRSSRENKEIEETSSSIETSILGLRPYKVASTDAVRKLIDMIPADVLKQAILEQIDKHGLLNVEHLFLTDLSDTDCVINWSKIGKVEKKQKIFSGDYSREMWDAINALDATSTGDDTSEVLYLIGCRLQELESKVDKKVGE